MSFDNTTPPPDDETNGHSGPQQAAVKTHVEGVDKTADEIATLASSYLMIFRTPELAAKKVVDYMREHYPDRVSAAYWITLSRPADLKAGTAERDRGVAIEIYKLPWRLRLQALIGSRSGGVGVFTPEIDIERMRVRVSVGVAAVAKYARPNEWSPVAAVTVRF